jgi:hypothetical protein
VKPAVLHLHPPATVEELRVLETLEEFTNGPTHLISRVVAVVHPENGCMLSFFFSVDCSSDLSENLMVWIQNQIKNVL